MIGSNLLAALGLAFRIGDGDAMPKMPDGWFRRGTPGKKIKTTPRMRFLRKQRNRKANRVARSERQRQRRVR